MKAYTDRNERCVPMPLEHVAVDVTDEEIARRVSIERRHEAVDSLDSPARPATLDPPVPPIGERGDSYEDEDMVSAMENKGLCYRICEACFNNGCRTIGDLRRVAATGEVTDWTLCGEKTLAEIRAAIRLLDAGGKE